jgi:hypothetical protein
MRGDSCLTEEAEFRHSAETSNKVEAQELHDRLKAEHWRVQKLGERPKHTWDEAASKWSQEAAHKRTHHEDLLKLDWLRPFLQNRVLTEITRDEIAAVGLQERRGEQRDSQPLPGSDPFDLAKGVPGMGMDRSGA